MFLKKYRQDATILAQNFVLPMNETSGLNNNVALIGATGTGKTNQFIKPNIMQMNSNYVISDPTGTLVRELGTMLEENGYKIKVLNLVDMEHSDMYNPLHYLQCDEDVFMVTDFLMSSVGGCQKDCDAFWYLASKSLISAIIFFLYKECLPLERNFTNVMKLLQAAVIKDDWSDYKSPLDIIFEDLEKKDPNHIAVLQYANFKKEQNYRAASSILSNACVYLQNFNLPEYEKLTHADSMELKELATGKMALFVIPPASDGSRDWLLGVFYNQLFDLLCRQDNKRHIRFYLDGASSVGKIPDFEGKLSLMREKNLSCVLSVQVVAQLELQFGVGAKSILSNCDSYVFMGSTNIDSCEDAAKRVCRKHVTARTIRYMGRKKCVVVCGDVASIYRKYDVKKHPRYNEIAECSDSPRRYALEEKHVVKVDSPDKVVKGKDRRRIAVERPYLHRRVKPVPVPKEVIPPVLVDEFDDFGVDGLYDDLLVTEGINLSAYDAVE